MEYSKSKTKVLAQPVAPSVSIRSVGKDLYLSSAVELAPVFKSLPHIFDNTAKKYPDRKFICEKDGESGEWVSITYMETLEASYRIAQGLINLGLKPGGCVSALSGASINHALVMLATLRCGAKFSPISVPYSLNGKDYTKLKNCIAVTKPDFIFAEDMASFLTAFKQVDDDDKVFVVPSKNAECGTLKGNVIVLDSLQLSSATDQVSQRMEGIRPDDCARIMFTSGSTGLPKAVPQPHSCLTVTVAQMESIGLLDFGAEGPQHLEAMPFHHIMAGNFNFNNMVRAGGTIWLDEGKPTPELFGLTLKNLKEVSPTFFITVPIALAMLCEAMQDDEELKESFFKKLVYIGYGGAALSQEIARKFQQLAVSVTGREIPIYSFYGATEFLFGTLKYWSDDNHDVIGLPLPGVELKLAATDGRYELCVKGATVMPKSGYLEHDLDMFDSEGFYRTGDIVRFKDESNPKLGLVFQGRLSEEFKLSTGTWVSVNEVRTKLIEACHPYLAEVVLCGENQDGIGGLLWLNESVVAKHGLAETREKLFESVKHYNSCNKASSKRLARSLVMRAPLSQSQGEITDKGNANQRLVKKNRAGDVARLFAGEGSDVVVF